MASHSSIRADTAGVCFLCSDAFPAKSLAIRAVCLSCGDAEYHTDCYEKHWHDHGLGGPSTGRATAPVPCPKLFATHCQGHIVSAQTVAVRDPAKKGNKATPVPSRAAPAAPAYSGSASTSSVLLKVVPAPTRGEPLVRKRLAKAAPVVVDRAEQAAQAARLRAEIAGTRQQPPAPAPAPVRSAAVPVGPAATRVRVNALVRPPPPPPLVKALPTLGGGPGVAAQNYVSPPPPAGGGAVAKAGELDRCVFDLAHYNRLIGAGSVEEEETAEWGTGENNVYESKTMAAGIPPPFEAKQQAALAVAEEPMFLGPSGERLTLAEYAALYNMTVAAMLDMYPDLVPGYKAPPPAAAAVYVEEEESEEEDMSDLLSLCMV